MSNLQGRYGGTFTLRGSYTYHSQVRWRGFKLLPGGDGSAVAMQARVIAAQMDGLISRDLASAAFLYLSREDYLVKLRNDGDLVTFPADIYGSSD